MKEEAVRSPCVSICALNEQDICVGCYRSGQEISHWGEYSQEQKRAALEAALSRRKAIRSISLD